VRLQREEGEQNLMATAMLDEQFRTITRLCYDPVVRCLEKLDASQFHTVPERPFSAIVKCCDALHFGDFYRHVGDVVGEFQPHTLTPHGGTFVLAPDPRVRLEPLIPFRFEAGKEIATAIWVKQKKIARFLCASHWPCGMAQALGLTEIDVIDLTLQGKVVVEASYEAFYRQMQLQDPHGMVEGHYEWARGVQVVPLLHVGYSDDAQKTWYIDKPRFREVLQSGALSITRKPIVDTSLLCSILECTTLAEEIARHIILGDIYP
jgi:hypothetical protein